MQPNEKMAIYQTRPLSHVYDAFVARYHFWYHRLHYIRKTETGNKLNIYSIRILTRPPLNLGVGENANSNLEENYFQMKTFVCYYQQNIRLSQFQWIENVVILMKFSSLAALEVVKMKKFKSRQ